MSLIFIAFQVDRLDVTTSNRPRSSSHIFYYRTFTCRFGGRIIFKILKSCRSLGENYVQRRTINTTYFIWPYTGSTRSGSTCICETSIERMRYSWVWINGPVSCQFRIETVAILPLAGIHVNGQNRNCASEYSIRSEITLTVTELQYEGRPILNNYYNHTI